MKKNAALADRLTSDSGSTEAATAATFPSQFLTLLDEVITRNYVHGRYKFQGVAITGNTQGCAV